MMLTGLHLSTLRLLARYHRRKLAEVEAEIARRP